MRKLPINKLLIVSLLEVSRCFLATLKGCLYLTVFLQDMSLFADMNKVYATYFDGDFPARSAVAVKALPKDALVEIECIAVR